VKAFDVIAFDLDDTLLDTTRLLMGPASKEACEAMIKAGLNTDLDTCLKVRRSFLLHNPSGDVYTYLAHYFGSAPDEADSVSKVGIATAGHRAFYSRQVEPHISLTEYSLQLLEELKFNYKLFLITAGDVPTQTQKVQFLKITSYFEKIFYINSYDKSETKLDAFKEISNSGIKPERHLSVGNRIDTDLTPAKAVGWKTCWVKYGEYAQLMPKSPIEQPDFTIQKIEELKQTCQL
jgi:putative hydrolase of the HAD superfamily